MIPKRSQHSTLSGYTLRALCTVLLFALLAACAAPTPTPLPPTPTPEPLRIMVMGDFVAEGFCDTPENCVPLIMMESRRPSQVGEELCEKATQTEGIKGTGYRAYLRDLLSGNGIKAVFVGKVEVVEGLAYEGRALWRIADMDYCVKNSDHLEQYRPDIILLNIGSADAAYGSEPGLVASDLIALLTDIYATVPATTAVMVAQVIPAGAHASPCVWEMLDGGNLGWMPMPYNWYVDRYNDLIAGIVEQFRASGKSVSFVDMTGVIESDADLSDWAIDPLYTVPNFFPKPVVYQRIAQIWYDKIVAVLAERR